MLDTIDLVLALRTYEHNRMNIDAGGQLVVFRHQGELYIFNRDSKKGYKLEPDFDLGVTVVAV